MNLQGCKSEPCKLFLLRPRFGHIRSLSHTLLSFLFYFLKQSFENINNTFPWPCTESFRLGPFTFSPHRHHSGGGTASVQTWGRVFLGGSLSCPFTLCVGCLLENRLHLELLGKVCLFKLLNIFWTSRFSLGYNNVNLQVNKWISGEVTLRLSVSPDSSSFLSRSRDCFHPLLQNLTGRICLD